MLDFAVYGIFIILLIASFGLNISYYAKNKKLQESAINIALEKYAISKKLQSVLAENEAKRLEKDDGFVKFLSQSRDQAFEYIENVQACIKTLEGSKRGTKEFNDTYKKLLTFLPDKSLKND